MDFSGMQVKKKGRRVRRLWPLRMLRRWMTHSG
jgi:hypothetical protein